MSAFRVILVCIFPHSDSIQRDTGVSLRIQSECNKIQTKITPNTDTFYAVQLYHFILLFKLILINKMTYEEQNDVLYIKFGEIAFVLSTFKLS